MADVKRMAPPAAFEPVEIELGDGRKRPLSYPIGTLKRMKVALGRSVFSGQGFQLDEDTIATLIWHGLHDAEGNPPDVTVPQIEALQPPFGWMRYLTESFMLAYSGSLPEKKAPETATPEKEVLN